MQQRRSTDRILPLQRPLRNGRTLPSKWDDADRWICTPSPAPPASYPPDGAVLVPKPKSKSGPLSRPYFPNSSSSSSSSNATLLPSASAMYCFSPFDASLTSSDEVKLHFRSGVLDEIFNGVKLGSDVADYPCAVPKRDMATQMSPMSSICSSPEARDSFSPIPPLPSSRGQFPLKQEARDVAASIMSGSKKPGEAPWTDSGDHRSSQAQVAASFWQFTDTAKDTSWWAHREEARIAAWENLQKAKAEAAIRKLEMKLERKRSTSTERIQSKLRAAERKAQEMRESLSYDRDASRKTKPLRRWFQCDAF